MTCHLIKGLAPIFNKMTCVVCKKKKLSKMFENKGDDTCLLW